MYFMSFPFV